MFFGAMRAKLHHARIGICVHETASQMGSQNFPFACACIDKVANTLCLHAFYERAYKRCAFILKDVVVLSAIAKLTLFYLYIILSALRRDLASFGRRWAPAEG